MEWNSETPGTSPRPLSLGAWGAITGAPTSGPDRPGGVAAHLAQVQVHGASAVMSLGHDRRGKGSWTIGPASRNVEKGRANRPGPDHSNEESHGTHLDHRVR